MKRLFIETKYTGKIELPKDLISELPGTVMLGGTVQFIEHLNEIKKKLEAYKKEVYLFRGIHGRYAGQILGCDNVREQSSLSTLGFQGNTQCFKISQNVDCFLYIGDGEFHPKALLINEKPVFCYNPLSEGWKKLGRKEWEELKLRNKVNLMKLYSANKVGIIVSTKEKQNLMQGQIVKLRERLEKEGKKVYLFLGDEIKGEDLKNFNFIDCWVNTACPRVGDDIKGMVNLRDLD